MNKRKICVVVTARPSYSRVKTALKAIQEHPKLELQLVIAASALLDRYGNAVNNIEEDGFKIAAKVFNVLEGENLTAAAKTTGIGILELSTVFDNLSPDMVVTVADRFETMATAISASYMNIPLAHIQGGEVTGNIDEKVRHAITKLADVHLVSSEKAAERVIKMGEEKDSVFVTGCPSIDLAKEVLESPELDFNPYEKYGGVGKFLDVDKGYVVVMQHPVTTEYQMARTHVEETLKAARDTQLPALWFWPNVDAGADGTSKGIRAFREWDDASNIHFFKNMNPTDFLKLINNCKVLVGNSSVAIREASFLGVPAVNIGSRQAGRDRGKNVTDVGYNKEAIHKAILDHVNKGKAERDELYGDGTAGYQIAEVLAEVPLKYDKKLTY